MTDPLFYAPGLVDAIRMSAVDHELVTHTYSHPKLGNISREVIWWEFERVRETHNIASLDRPTTLLLPRHSRRLSTL